MFDIRIFQSTRSFGSATLSLAIAWVYFAIDKDGKPVELLLYNVRGKETSEVFGFGYKVIVMQHYDMRFVSTVKRYNRNEDTQQGRPPPKDVICGL